MRIPSHSIDYGVEINGVRIDPVTYLMFILMDKFEHFEDERQLDQETRLIDFIAHAGERIAATLARFEMARFDAQQIGFDIPRVTIWSSAGIADAATA